MANHETNDISQMQPTWMQGRAIVRDGRIGQSVCAKCGKTVRPGGGIVLEFGAGGRVHKECLKISAGTDV